MTTELEPELELGTDKPRCKDCDEDCWHVNNKLSCWMGGTTFDLVIGITYSTEIADGYCPWLMAGIPFPPKP